MTTNFPNAIQDLGATRGTAGQSLGDTDGKNHITHHQNEDDTISALQTKVGIDNSSDTNSLDYKVRQVENKISSVSSGSTISLSSKGGIHNSKFIYDVNKTDSGLSSAYDSLVYYTGNRSLKLSFTTSASDYLDLTNFTNISNGKVYRMKFWAKASAAKSIKFMSGGQTFGTWSVSTDWAMYVCTFTASASYSLLRIAANDAILSVVYIDNIELEEVITDATSLSAFTRSDIILTASSTIDSVDQSATNTGFSLVLGDGGTYQKLAQQFLPTKKYLSGVSIRKENNIGNPTFDVVFTIQTDSANTPGTTVLAQKLVSAATWDAIPNATEHFVEMPCILDTSGSTKYWIVMTPSAQGNASNYRSISSNYQTYTNGLLGYNGSSWTTNPDYDMYFKTHYVRRTQGVSVSINGKKVEAYADQDGLLNGSVIDITNGKYSYDVGYNISNSNYLINCAKDFFSATSGGGSSGAVINGFNTDGWANGYYSVNAATCVIKVNTLLPINKLKIRWQSYKWAAGNRNLKISLDNITYVTIDTHNTPNLTQENVVYTDIANGVNSFYLQVDNPGSNNFLVKSIEADLDISGLGLGGLYPLSVNKFVKLFKFANNVSRVYFRLNKFINADNVCMPALEFTDNSGKYIGHVALEIDNSAEDNPCVEILSDSTSFALAGTGSADSSVGYILNDGEYMTFSSALTEGKVSYKVGRGTTNLSNITKNLIYVSSESIGSDESKKASLQGNFILTFTDRGLTNKMSDIYKTKDNKIKNEYTNTKETLKIGNYHLWVDATSKLRIKLGIPTSDTDGSLV